MILTLMSEINENKYKVRRYVSTNLLGQPLVAMVAQSLNTPLTSNSLQPLTRPVCYGFGGYQWYHRPGAASSIHH